MGILTVAVLVVAAVLEALAAAVDSEGAALSAEDDSADADETVATLAADADCGADGAGGLKRFTKTRAMTITSTSAMAANAMSFVVGDNCERKPEERLGAG